MRYTAEETYSAANRIRRQTELRQIAGWSDCQNPKSVDGKVADENAFPPAARVSAEARDENE